MTERAQQELPGGVIRHESGLIADMEDAARKWATERGLVIKEHGVTCDSCDQSRVDGWVDTYDGGGAILGIRELCWSCLPVPGSPLASWEYWWTGSLREEACVRCEKPLRGGSFFRGGPLCWNCDRPSDEELRAYLLRLRDEPDAKPPWAGDRGQGEVTT